MKKFLKQALFIASLIPSFSFAQEEMSTLKFNFEGNNPTGKVYIKYNLYGPVKIDSILAKNNSAEFKLAVKVPTQVTLSFSQDGNVNKEKSLVDTRTIYIEKGTATIKIKDSIRSAVISGMPINEKYEHYINYLKPSEALFAEIRKDYDALTAVQKQDLKYTKSIFDKQNDVNLVRKELVSKYVHENPTSLFSTHGLRGIYHLLLPGEFDNLFNSLSEENKQSSVGVMLKDYLEAAKIAGIGNVAPDFTQNDVNGNPVKLSDFRGKYVLLDFWASWCAPCRAENPNLVNAYHKYKDKGFTVLGVSLDSPNGRDAWLSAIEKDKLAWTNLSDLKGWKNEASRLYMVRAVPQNYLIDPDGKVIAVNLKGYKLGEKLEEILNQ